MWFLEDESGAVPSRPGREIFRFLGRASLLVLLCYITAVVHGTHLYAWYAAFRLNDLGKFLQTARLMRAGCADPYLPGFHTLVEVEGIHRHFLDLNPPQFHLLLYPLTGLPDDMAAGVWLLVQFAAGAAGLLIVWRSLKLETCSPRTRIGLLFLLLLSTPTLAILITGQFTLILFLLVALAWRDIRAGRWTRGCLFLGIGLGIKPFFLILLPWLLIRRKWAATLTFLGSAIALYAIGFGVQGPHRMALARGVAKCRLALGADECESARIPGSLFWV